MTAISSAATIIGAGGTAGGNGTASSGGAGGDGGNAAGSGGAGATTSVGANGAAGSGGTGGGGGGGGFALDGGAGGNSDFGTGGAAGTIYLAPKGGGEEAGGGGAFGGSSAIDAGGGGGGGGGRGETISANSATIQGADSVTGGSGGKGGNGLGSFGDGGGGGGGGIGVVFTGAGSLTVNGVISGGNGGNGGDGGLGFGAVGSFSGGGGAGGSGLRTTQTTATVIVNGTVTGGNGGANGVSQHSPAHSGGGSGGTGIVAATIINNGIVNGGNGAATSTGGGGGGSGGAGGNGAVVTGTTMSSNSTTGTITGGNGGAGAGALQGDGGNGGKGGNGGSGLSFTASGATFTNQGTITAGNGGAGGAGANSTYGGGNGGNGGAGGIGLSFTASGATVTNQGTISGGNGAAGGAGGADLGTYVPPAVPSPGVAGSNGAGGAGVSGSNLAIINSGSITGGLASDGVTRANAITFTGGTNQLTIQSGARFTGNVVFGASTSANVLTLEANPTPNATTFTGNGGTDKLRLGGSTGGTFDTSTIGTTYAGFTTYEKVGSSTWTLTNATNAVTPWTVTQGTLTLSAGATLGATTASATVSTGGTLDLGGTTQTQTALNLDGGTLQNGSLNAAITSTGGTINGISGSASLNATSGTTLVIGNDTFTGGTTVTNATLTVNGSLNDPTIGAGGLLNGTGSVGDTTIQSGGMFAPGAGTPGTSMTVNGNLAFQSGALYVVAVNPTTSSFATVTGTATLGGATVNAAFANGSYISKRYTILTAGSVSGTFGSLANTNLPANFNDALSYDATHAYLNLSLNFTPAASPNFGNGLSSNQQAVGNALIRYFNVNGGIPMVYGTLTAAGLTQASGELATAPQQATFDAMTMFMGLMTDPFNAGRGDPFPTPGASGYADQALGYAVTDKRGAYAMFTKAPVAPTFEQRWSVWAAGYGGSQTTDGNVAAGSNTASSSVFGTAVGADYRFSPNTIAGFALAGGGTNFSVANSGTGHSDLFQAGAYVRHVQGAAYITAALAYGWQDITTDRYVTVAGADHLHAEFNANAWSGRLEGGYRFIVPGSSGIGLSPYAAAQFTTFDLPAYTESVAGGAGAFALNYAGKDVTDTRSELGIRTDKSFVISDGLLTLRSRFGWAHDYNADRSVAATFQALPGASFVVNGAAQASDSVLTTASAETRWTNGWSTAATFEGEFSNVTRSYAGKGVVRYTW